MPEDFYHEDIHQVPTGYRVRTLTTATGHEVRLAFPPGPRKRGSGRLVSILHPHVKNTCAEIKRSALSNPHEMVKDSKGKQWFTGVTASGSDYMAEAYPVTGKKIKRVGAPVTARGATEAAAYDALLRKIEPNPRKRQDFAQAQKNPKTRNFDEINEAKRTYKKFQGKESKNVLDINEPGQARDDFAELGWLTELVIQSRAHSPEVADPDEVAGMWEEASQSDKQTSRVWTDIARDLNVTFIVISFRKDKVRLTSSPNGNQLYCIGGSQNLDSALGRFGVDESKDFVELGFGTAVTYLARKANTDFEPVEHVHTLGEDGGMPPIISYNKLQKRIGFVGGTYKVAPEGIIH